MLYSVFVILTAKRITTPEAQILNLTGLSFLQLCYRLGEEEFSFPGVSSSSDMHPDPNSHHDPAILMITSVSHCRRKLPKVSTGTEYQPEWSPALSSCSEFMFRYMVMASLDLELSNLDDRS
mmetsp:Transcript_61788/g.70877  ORF Transcript_61788/g.70877 Transcript_61788/m.70877 type:complete len:122 (-) Transcript_61788:83-448(-)